MGKVERENICIRALRQYLEKRARGCMARGCRGEIDVYGSIIYRNFRMRDARARL